MSQGVLVCVAGRVVALSPRPGDAHTRRKEDEKVHIPRQVLVQVPAALDFGPCRIEELLARHVLVNLSGGGNN